MAKTGKKKRRSKDEIINARIRYIWSHMKRRLGEPPFHRWQLVDKVRAALEGRAAVCTYCKQFLKPTTFSVDHMTPISRGGENTLSNINVRVCIGCNRGKGRLTHEEFSAVMDVVNGLPDECRAHLVAVLKTGSAVRFGFASRRQNQ